MILALALTTATWLGSPAGSAQEPVDAPPKGTAEDVEVMRRLLVKELDELGPAQRDASTADAFTVINGFSGVYSLGGRSGAVTHARGFVVPGMGAVFAIDLELPVYETEGRASAEEPRGDDAWEEARREAQSGTGSPGSQRSMSAGRAKTFELDPQAIEQAIDGVVEVLSRHGHRIQGLEPGESLTVCLHASSSGGFGSRTGMAPPASPEGVFWSATTPLLHLAAPDVCIVVRLPLETIRDYIDDRIDRAGVAKRAAITRY